MSKLSCGLLLTCCLLPLSCTSTGDQALPLRTPLASPTSKSERVIALIGTMSGPDRWRGSDAFEGANLGVQALNRNVAPGRPQFQLVTRDDEGDAERATALVKEETTDARVQGVVYAGPPEGLPPAEEALDSAGIPALLCYGDLAGAGLLRSHTFQVSPTYPWEARSLVSYALKDRHYRRLGLLVDTSLTGQTAQRAIAAEARALGKARITTARYAPDTADFAPALEKLKRARVSAVVVAASPPHFVRVQRTLRSMDARYRSTSDARSPRGPWRPQVLAFDGAVAPQPYQVFPGTVASDSYSRGAHYLPLPGFREFASAFEKWWGKRPLGWEVRSYDAVQMIGWASFRADVNEDIASVLEGINGQRFAGLPIALSSRDHLALDQDAIGLWVVPRTTEYVYERTVLPVSLPWVPLARSFSRNERRTSIPAADWGPLFIGGNRAKRAPSVYKMRYGITSRRSDPFH
ncbi:MAG: ABC transporter substrate-binding protein [Actinomycetota bacterium]|nr:ABC transporter substrate-binding protein [Actinomycetota bacterium]